MHELLNKRSSGLFLHPTSFPDAGPIGTIGALAYGFVEFLERARQRFWQMLPLTPTSLDGSPYGAISAMACNPWMIDEASLVAEGWLDTSDQHTGGPLTESVCFRTAAARSERLLPGLLRNRGNWSKALADRHEAFRESESEWLDDFALFAALREHYENRPWTSWPSDLVRREPAALRAAREKLSAEVEMVEIAQLVFQEQWRALKTFANQRGVCLIGDIPIYVATDSADVWANQDIFALGPDGTPTHVSGVPPDAFSDTGQRWGGALYRWDVLEDRSFDWWLERFRRTFDLFDVVRIDHFRGFDAYWEIPADEPTAIKGRWVEGPKDALFHAVRGALGDLAIIAEDLGIITSSVNELRERLGFPGIRVLQFAFDSDDANPHLPAKYTGDVVAYPGTHDNDTSAGWFETISPHTLSRLETCVGGPVDTPSSSLLELAWQSQANTAIATVQDLLGLGTKARMNTPATIEGNWCWRLSPGALTDDLADRLGRLTRETGRVQLA